MREAQILPATIEHLPAIQNLAAVIWRAYYPGIITGEQIEYMLARMYALETLRAEIQTRGIHYDRLLLGRELIGFAAYGPGETPVTWKLHKLYLLPERHGLGLGSQLLQHCEAHARSHGATRLVLNVNKRNARAIAAYIRNGYSIWESVCLDIGDGFAMDDFVMAKELR